MVRAATTECNDVINLHLGMGLAAVRADGGGSYLFDVGGGNLADVPFSGPTIDPARAHDGRRLVWIGRSPRLVVFGVSLWVFFAPFLRSRLDLRGMGRIGVTLLGFLAVLFGILLSAFSAGGIVDGSSALSVSAQFLTLLFAVALLVGVVSLLIFDAPLSCAFARRLSVLWLLIVRGVSGERRQPVALDATSIDRLPLGNVSLGAWLAGEVAREATRLRLLFRDKFHSLIVGVVAPGRNYMVAR